MIIIVMGVSGSGKSTIGALLAGDLRWRFLDADDFHTVENREKMRRGIPLTDQDRAEWLLTLRNTLAQQTMLNRSVVLACSALKEAYRRAIRVNGALTRIVYLKGSPDLIRKRMKRRKGHYMRPEMLASQLSILEEPRDALVVDIADTPGQIVEAIRVGLNV